MSAVDTAARSDAQPSAASLARPQLYAAAMLLLLANAAAEKAIAAFVTLRPLEALAGGLGHSWAFWLACAAALRLALTEPAAPVQRRDLWTCGACAIAAMVPVSPLAGLALSALAAVVLTDRSHGPRLRAAAWVLAAISVQLVWSKLLMLFFAQPIAAADAHLVSWIVHRPASGNLVGFAQGRHTLTILAACTSVQNASTALMLYVAVVRSFRAQPRRSEALALLGVFASVVAINVARLSLMAWDERMYHLVHGDVGAAVVNAAITLTGLAWAWGSVRHEI